MEVDVPALGYAYADLWVFVNTTLARYEQQKSVPAAANERLKTGEGSKMMMGKMCAACADQSVTSWVACGA